MVMSRPRTFLNLLIVGFIIVSLPLSVALFSTLSYLNKLNSQSIEIVKYTMGGIRDSQRLSEYLLNEERHMRLFEIVRSEKHISTAIKWHKRSAELVENLLKLPVTGDERKNLLTMESLQETLASQLLLFQKDPSSNSFAVKSLFGRIKDIQTQGERISIDISNWVEVEINTMKQFVNNARKTLIYQTIGFLVLTILMIAAFAMLISWPIRQLNRSVERLGMGDFSSPIFVVGPKDIEIVGEKLEWLRKRLSFLEQEKGKFLAHISHELKTPLASIREGAGLLSEEVVGPLDEKQRRVASILVNNSIKLQQLIDNMLKLNMARVGEQDLRCEMIQLRPLIEKVAREQTNKVLSKELNLELNLLDVIIFGDTKMIEDIFENLFSNAVKFSPVGGVVGCTMEVTGKQLRCLIHDEGPGIDKEEVEKIFTAYYKIDSKAHGNKEGSGLGLAIAREYVENHGGSLEIVESGQPGGKFCVILPLEQQKAEE